ncbi:MAG TPA: DUF3027 domain-containing protein [Candidatus Lumbricidophila sp.]|nr:DUF3027 domain-containing protein [Candidatus Lumbricidophila sp.]
MPEPQVEPAAEFANPAPEFEADQVLLGASAIAQQALLQITAPTTVGPQIGHRVDGEHVLTLFFAADVSGYPGWRWAVTLARVVDGEPTVSETELIPGDGALVAPEWVPWSVRLAEYHAAQAAAKAAGELVEDEFLPGGDEGDADGELDAVDRDADDEFDDDDEVEPDERDDDDDDFDEDDLAPDFDDEFELNHDPDQDDEGFIDDERGDASEEE